MNEWISVEDRLPEDEKRYAVLYRYKDSGFTKAFIGDWDSVGERWYNNGLDDITITHWMALPEAPNEGS